MVLTSSLDFIGHKTGEYNIFTGLKMPLIKRTFDGGKTICGENKAVVLCQRL